MQICTDFTAAYSDITCGSVGTDEGWTTCIVRSQKGAELLEKAKEKGYIEVNDKVDLETVKRTAGFKGKKRAQVLEERKEGKKYIPDYS